MKLNIFQYIVLTIYVFVIVMLCLLSVPKSYIGLYQGTTIVVPVERAPLWARSHHYGDDRDYHVRVDYYRMLTEVFATTLIFGVVFIGGSIFSHTKIQFNAKKFWKIVKIILIVVGIFFGALFVIALIIALIQGDDYYAWTYSQTWQYLQHSCGYWL